MSQFGDALFELLDCRFKILNVLFCVGQKLPEQVANFVGIGSAHILNNQHTLFVLIEYRSLGVLKNSIGEWVSLLDLVRNLSFKVFIWPFSLPIATSKVVIA